MPGPIRPAALEITVSDLREAMGGVDAHFATMSCRMWPVIRRLRVAGPAVTALSAASDNLMMHRALAFAHEGDVLVLQSGGNGARWDDVSAQSTVVKEIAGVEVAAMSGTTTR